MRTDEYAAWLLPLLAPSPRPDSSGGGAEATDRPSAAAEAAARGEGGSSGGGGGGRHSLSAVLADVKLVSAAATAAVAAAADNDRGAVGENEGLSGDVGSGGGERGGEDGGGDAVATAVGYLLQRELRWHPVWSTVELWEVSMSDSVVMAMEGGGARSERWLPAGTLTALEEVFYVLKYIHGSGTRRFFTRSFFFSLLCLYLFLLFLLLFHLVLFCLLVHMPFFPRPPTCRVRRKTSEASSGGACTLTR